MTFILKAVEDLKKGFKTAVELELDDHNKKEITKLHEPRRSQLLFLETIFDEIDKDIKKKTKSTSEHSQILYGAMLLVIEDIGAKNNSNLRNRLLSCMGITKNDQLSPQQLKRCHQAFNHFLQSIFKSNSSCNGFADSFALQSISAEKLAVLAKTSYTLEKKAFELEAKSLVVEGASTGSESTFKLKKEFNIEIINRFTSWQTVKDKFNALVMKETSKKQTSDIKELTKERSLQLQFLKEIASCLDKSSLGEDSKIAVFAGAMHIIRGQISKSYKYDLLYDGSVTSKVYLTSLSLQESIIHEGLGEIIQIKNESKQNIEMLLQAAYQFLRHMTIEPGVVKKDGTNSAPTIRKTHLLSSIQDFNLKDMLNFNQEMICACRIAAIDQCMDKFKAELEKQKKAEKAAENLKPKEKSSWWFFSAKTDKAESKELPDLDDMLNPLESDENTTTPSSTVNATSI